MPCGSPVIARPVGPSGDCACGSHPDPLATTGVTVVDIANDPHRPSCLLGKKSSGYNGFCVRRAKLGVASRGQVPASEALARHRVLSVASLPVTSTSKRTQGVRGPQCESVKGLSSAIVRIVGADMLQNMESNLNRAEGHGPGEPTGVRDRGTCTR